LLGAKEETEIAAGYATKAEFGVVDEKWPCSVIISPTRGSDLIMEISPNVSMTSVNHSSNGPEYTSSSYPIYIHGLGTGLL
jgi:hypothetical protein